MSPVDFQADRHYSQNAIDRKQLERTQPESHEGSGATVLKVIAIAAAIFLVLAAAATMPPELALLAALVIILASGTVVVHSPRIVYWAFPGRVWIPSPAPLPIRQPSRWGLWPTFRRPSPAPAPVHLQPSSPPPRASSAGSSWLTSSTPARSSSWAAPGTGNVRVGVPQPFRSTTRTGNVIPGRRDYSPLTSSGKVIPGRR